DGGPCGSRPRWASGSCSAGTAVERLARGPPEVARDDWISPRSFGTTGRVSGTLQHAVSSAFEPDPPAVLAAAQRGDASAQAALFEAHKHRVARQIVRMTGDASVVDDLVQEVFIAAFSRLATFRGDAQIDTWLFTITTNKVRNWWDSERRRSAR